MNTITRHDATVLPNAIKFSNTTQWRKHLSSFDVLLSGRVHGCMMGLYADIPYIVIPDDYRLFELSEQMMIPSFDAGRITDSTTVEHIIKHTVFNDRAFDDNRAFTLDISLSNC